MVKRDFFKNTEEKETLAFYFAFTHKEKIILHHLKLSCFIFFVQHVVFTLQVKQ